jgi:hypothetical protein
MISVPSEYLDRLLQDKRWIQSVPVQCADLPEDLVAQFNDRMQIHLNNDNDDDELTEIESQPNSPDEYECDTEVDDMDVTEDVHSQNDQPAVSWIELRKRQIREK